MSNELQIIDTREVLGKPFQIYGDFENPLFLAKDLAERIEHSNHRAMLETVDEAEKVKLNPGVSIPYAGGDREYWFLTEDGLYEVLMQSRKPIAKEFKREVKKILKEIRKTGSYSAIPNQSQNSLHVNGHSIEIPEERQFSFSISKGGAITVRVKEGKPKPELSLIPDKAACVEKCPHYVDQSELFQLRIMNRLIDSPDWLTAREIALLNGASEVQTEYYLERLLGKGAVGKRFSSAKQDRVYSLAKRMPPK